MVQPVTLLLPLASLLFCPPFAFGQTQARDALESAWIEPHVGATLPLTAKFVDHTNRSAQLGEISARRPMLLCLVYFECPMLCKLSADGLIKSVSSLRERVGQDFDVVFVSFDVRDTPERASAACEQALRKYARQGTEQGWHFLTGSQESIDQLTDAVGFHYMWDKETKQFSHATGIIVVTPDGKISEYLDGISYSPNDLIAAVHRAANNELTEPTSSIFVRCYLYDPTTGRFGYAVQWTIRVLGVLTVVAITALVIVLGRRSAQTDERSQS